MKFKIPLKFAALLLSALLAAGCGAARKGAGDVVDEEDVARPGQVASSVGVPEQLTFNSSDNGIANWSPDGGSIVFQSNRDGRWQIYEMDLTDRIERKLIDSDANDEHPVWIPDGSGLLFVSDRDGTGEFDRNIYFYSPLEAAVTPLTSESGDEWYPVPVDENTFIYLKEPSLPGDDTPVVQRANILIKGGYFTGDTPVELIGAAADVSAPAILGDGRLAVRTRGGRLELFDPTTGDFELLTPSNMRVGHTDFNRTAGALAFTAQIGNDSGLFLYNISRRTFQRIESLTGDIRFPRFSPDGSFILYSQEVDGYFQIFRLNVQFYN